MTKLEQSTQDSSSEQQTLQQLINDLTQLKTTMQTTLTNLQAQQADFSSYLEVLKPLAQPLKTN